MRCTSLLTPIAAGLLLAMGCARAADRTATAIAAGSPQTWSAPTGTPQVWEPQVWKPQVGKPAAAPTRVEPFWLEPDLPPGATPYLVPATLRIPAHWVGGDGAVIILSDPDSPTSGPLVTALLAEGALVLELDIAAALAQASDPATASQALSAEALRADLAIALDQLRREVGAGLVVAIGTGPASGSATLAALPRAPELTAAIALHGETARIEAKGSDAARATLGGLCRALDGIGNQAVAACRAALFKAQTHATR